MRAIERRLIEIERKLGCGGTPTPAEAMAAARRLQRSTLGKLSNAFTECTGERLPQTLEEVAFAREYTQADRERDEEINRRWCQGLGINYEVPNARERLERELDSIARNMGKH